MAADPRAWGEEPPAELLGPTRLPEINLAIKILSYDHVGHDVWIWTGRFITEHSVFNLWFLEHVKGTGVYSVAEMLELTDVPNQLGQRVYEQWTKFMAAGDTAAEEQGRRRAEALRGLVASLESAVATMTSYRLEIR